MPAVGRPVYRLRERGHPQDREDERREANNAVHITSDREPRVVVRRGSNVLTMILFVCFYCSPADLLRAAVDGVFPLRGFTRFTGS